MMSEMTLTKTRLIEGVWEGELTCDGPYEGEVELEVTHLAKPIDGVQVIAREDGHGWAVRVPIPVELIADGVQTFLISDKKTGVELDSFSLLSGEALSYDIRAEMALLREELDMLKRAFRRHCLETK
jgi:hypothetical protein